jgi:hypothetical protein
MTWFPLLRISCSTDGARIIHLAGRLKKSSRNSSQIKMRRKNRVRNKVRGMDPRDRHHLHLHRHLHSIRSHIPTISDLGSHDYLARLHPEHRPVPLYRQLAPRRHGQEGGAIKRPWDFNGVPLPPHKSIPTQWRPRTRMRRPQPCHQKTRAQ